MKNWYHKRYKPVTCGPKDKKPKDLGHNVAVISEFQIYETDNGAFREDFHHSKSVILYIMF